MFTCRMRICITDLEKWLHGFFVFGTAWMLQVPLVVLSTMPMFFISFRGLPTPWLCFQVSIKDSEPRRMWFDVGQTDADLPCLDTEQMPPPTSLCQNILRTVLGWDIVRFMTSVTWIVGCPRMDDLSFSRNTAMSCDKLGIFVGADSCGQLYFGSMSLIGGLYLHSSLRFWHVRQGVVMSEYVETRDDGIVDRKLIRSTVWGTRFFFFSVVDAHEKRGALLLCLILFGGTYVRSISLPFYASACENDKTEQPFLDSRAFPPELIWAWTFFEWCVVVINGMTPKHPWIHDTCGCIKAHTVCECVQGKGRGHMLG